MEQRSHTEGGARSQRNKSPCDDLFPSGTTGSVRTQVWLERRPWSKKGQVVGILAANSGRALAYNGELWRALEQSKCVSLANCLRKMSLVYRGDQREGSRDHTEMLNGRIGRFPQLPMNKI